jgi:hypothetical protein
MSFTPPVTIRLFKRQAGFTYVQDTSGQGGRQELLTQGLAPVKKLITERHCIYVRRCGTSIEELKERNAEKPPPYSTYERYGSCYPRATNWASLSYV